jgi:DNA-directed RNA polymerase subunit RPC12/RpoP
LAEEIEDEPSRSEVITDLLEFALDHEDEVFEESDSDESDESESEYECTDCGADVGEEDKFCQNCGEKLEGFEEEETKD